MPFSVSCKSCGSRFLMGDDLFRRKVAGKVVTVRCRHCSAEISVDASDSDPRPLPPRPPRPGALEGRLVALSPGLMNAPEPGHPSQTLKGLSSPELDSTPPLDGDEPAGIEDEFVEELPPSVPDPQPPEAELDEAEVNSGELIEAELSSRDFTPPPEPPEPPISEPPPSSSGTPALHMLTGPAHVEPKARRDDFEIAFGGPSTLFGLGPPTIDVSNLDSPKDEDSSPMSDRRGAPTMPLFDMSSDLDQIPEEARSEPSSSPVPAKAKRRKESQPPSLPGGKRKRKRKPVAPPLPAQTRESRSEPPEQRSGSAVWAALAVLGIAGGGAWFMRDRAAPEPATPAPVAAAETTPAVPLPPAPAPTPGPTPDLAPLAGPVIETAPAPAAGEPKAEKPASEKPAGEKPASEKPAEPTKPAAANTPAEPAAAEATPPAPAEPEAPAITDPFNKGAAAAALQSAAAEAATCRKPGDPTGIANVVVTFAPSGRVTTANVSGIFAGTPTGGCVASKLRRAKVPPFAGELTTVSKTVVIQ